MMNRVGLGLAVGAGYVLGRTKKMKTAFAVGTMVAGKRMHLSPKALADLVNQQLQNNPQFKEIGDQLREDLRGVGTAASGALVERRIDALADRLHGRTEQVRGQLAGVTPDVPGLRDEEEPEDEREESEEPDEAEEEPEADAEGESEEPEAEERAEAGAEEPQKEKGAAEKAGAGKKAAKKAPGKRSASKGPAKKAPAKKTAGHKTAAKSAKRAPTKKTAARGRAAEGRQER